MRIAMTTVSIGMAIVSIALLALAEPASAAQSRTFSVSVSRHADTSPALSDEQARKILDGASTILQENGCDITFTLKGPVKIFDSPETPSIVEKSHIDAVHRVHESTRADLHVKVVKKITEFCRFEGDNFSGCAWPINFRSIIVVDRPQGGTPLGDDDRPLSSFLWAHEFGHLMGLGHSLESNSLMTPCPIKKTDKVVTEHECTCYLSGPGFGPNGICDLRSVGCPQPQP